MRTVPVPACLCCSRVRVTESFACWGQRCLTPSRRWKLLCAAWPSSFNRKVSHGNIFLQRETFRFLLILAALNVFTGESMPKVFLSSDQVFLFHLETFQCYQPYSTFHYIFQFPNCLEKKKEAFTMSVISKVKGLGIKIRTGSLQQFLTFFNKEEGGILPFIDIYCQHSFCLLQSLTKWAT